MLHRVFPKTVDRLAINGVIPCAAQPFIDIWNALLGSTNERPPKKQAHTTIPGTTGNSIALSPLSEPALFPVFPFVGDNLAIVRQ